VGEANLQSIASTNDERTTTTTSLGEKASFVYPGKYLFPICFIVYKFVFYMFKKTKNKINSYSYL
jgi:hypothetical protein